MVFKNVETDILDHIIHLTPPGSLQETIAQFKSLGFNVIAGGTHADGLTENALVVLSDESYIELISFTHTVSYYPLGSPEREARERHSWSEANGKRPGWVDFSFLGLGSSNPAPNQASDASYTADSVEATASESSVIELSEVINERAEREGSGVAYLHSAPGGRTRPDGRELRWIITVPNPQQHGRGSLPFFCGDVTDRALRVPLYPTSNGQHANTARGVAHIRLVVPDASSLSRFAPQLTTVVGHAPIEESSSEIAWSLKTPASLGGSGKGDDESSYREGARLLLSVAQTKDDVSLPERPTLHEIALWADVNRAPETTPFGTLVWVVHPSHTKD